MSLAALALGAAGAAGLYAAAVEPRRLCLRQPRVRVAAWPAGDPPLRIGVLSDLHAAWPHVTLGRIGRIVARLLAARPDLVLLPGDFVTTHTLLVRRIPIEPVAEALARLARAVPTLAVLGNHDWHYGGERIASALERAGIAVLRNAATRVETAQGRLWVAGLDDIWTGRADLARTLRNLDRSAPAVMLSHLPDVFPVLPPEIALTVAGHTHGGQVCVPGLGPLRVCTRLPRRLAYGLHEIDGRHLYVSGGIGTSALPIRFWRPPEIALLTLGAPA
ncbi:metallophosphoesterase [Benzoatithermus flavus]|uniref:Metallophosphoesterase n=1 Tax=Benzoatithermus flavus TaxID=3108223 RepID=A0ABU8XM23_9PROT